MSEPMLTLVEAPKTTTEQDLRSLRETVKALRHLGITEKWLRTEAQERRIPACITPHKVLFDVAAVRRTLLERANSLSPI